MKCSDACCQDQNAPTREKTFVLTGQREDFGSALLHSRDREAECHLLIKELKQDVLDVFNGVGGTVGGSSTDASASSEQTEQLQRANELTSSMAHRYFVDLVCRRLRTVMLAKRCQQDA